MHASLRGGAGMGCVWGEVASADSSVDLPPLAAKSDTGTGL